VTKNRELVARVAAAMPLFRLHLVPSPMKLATIFRHPEICRFFVLDFGYGQRTMLQCTR